MSADIRPAGALDIDALLHIENTVFETDRISSRSLRRLIRSPTACLLVADSGAPVGYALVLFRRLASAARLYSLAVAPESAAAGLGRRLLAEAEKAAARRGCRSLRLEVREDNVRAIGLYERAGYRRIGRREGYYGDGAAALRFEKHLNERESE